MNIIKTYQLIEFFNILTNNVIVLCEMYKNYRK